MRIRCRCRRSERRPGPGATCGTIFLALSIWSCPCRKTRFSFWNPGHRAPAGAHAGRGQRSGKVAGSVGCRGVESGRDATRPGCVFLDVSSLLIHELLVVREHLSLHLRSHSKAIMHSCSILACFAMFIAAVESRAGLRERPVRADSALLARLPRAWRATGSHAVTLARACP
jgi:hypothetical protein